MILEYDDADLVDMLGNAGRTDYGRVVVDWLRNNRERLADICCSATEGPKLYRAQGAVGVIKELVDLLTAEDTAPSQAAVGFLEGTTGV